MVEQGRYQIRIQGWLSDRWGDWLDGLHIAHDGTDDGVPTTTLTGKIADQAALRSLLCRIWDLNLVLITVERIGPGPRQEGGGRDG